jgi:hypothetical protein
MRLVLSILGATFIVVGVGVWTFLFLFSDTPSEEGGQSSFPQDIQQPESEGDTLSAEVIFDRFGFSGSGFGSQLFQLTTKRVAGAVLFEREGDTYVRFVEAGTGHAYEIALGSRNETRISNTTFAKTVGAVWSQSGNRVVVIQEEEGGHRAFLGALQRDDDGENALSGEALPVGVDNIAFSESGNTLYFVSSNGNGSAGIALDVVTNERSTVFNVPQREIVVSWNPEPIIVTKPAAMLEGYAHTAALARVFGGAHGLVVEQNEVSGAVATYRESDQLLSTFVDSSINADLPVIPQKCDEAQGALVCAIPSGINTRTFPDAWYQGSEVYEDVFWTIDPQTGAAEQLINPQAETGRSVDVIDFSVGPNETYATFRNKTDSSLWLLRL